MNRIICTICLLFLVNGCSAFGLSSRKYEGRNVSAIVLYKPGLTLEEALERYSLIARSVVSTGPIIRTARSEVRIFNSALEKDGFINLKPENLPDDIRFGCTSTTFGDECWTLNIAGK